MSTTVVILAGGKGTRLRPFTLYRPKPLMPVANKPVLNYVLDLVELSGIAERVIVLLDYMGDKIAQYLTREKRGVEVIPAVAKSLDTADAVRRARHLIDGDFLVIMGDLVTNCDLSVLWKVHKKREGIATLALRDVETPNHYGLAFLDSSDRVKYFLEKPFHYELYLISLASRYSRVKYYYANLANMGIYALSYNVLDILDDNPHLLDFSRHLFPFLIEENYPIYGWYAGSCYWIDIGLPQTYLKANLDVLDRLAKPLRPSGTYSGGAWISQPCQVIGTVHPPIAIGRDVTVEYEAEVGPYAVLGENVRVATEAKVVESILMCGTEIAAGSIVAGSVLGANVKVGKNAVIVRSLVEDGAYVPEGTKVIGRIFPAKKRAVASIEVGA